MERGVETYGNLTHSLKLFSTTKMSLNNHTSVITYNLFFRIMLA